MSGVREQKQTIARLAPENLTRASFETGSQAVFLRPVLTTTSHHLRLALIAFQAASESM